MPFRRRVAARARDRNYLLTNALRQLDFDYPRQGYCPQPFRGTHAKRSNPPTAAERIVDWEIPDPVCEPYERHCEIRDEIERRVMTLVLELRRGGPAES